MIATAPIAQIVTLLGQWPLSHKWVPDCVRSWKHLSGVSANVGVVSDGSLEPGTDLSPLGDVACLLNADQEAVVADRLSSYPHLIAMRKADLTWRKILDTSILFATRDRILLIDTDVLVTHRALLPDASGFYYLREDVPAYQGLPWLPLRERMVLSFNAGFVLYSPRDVDFAFLDHAARRYFLPLKNYWWSEQAAWSLLAARSRSPRYWDGRDARCLSGFASRTESEVAGNVVKYTSSRVKLDREQMRAMAGEASVLHLAGAGKHHWDAFTVDASAEARPLRAIADPLLTPGQRIAVGTRLLIKYVSGVVT